MGQPHGGRRRASTVNEVSGSRVGRPLWTTARTLSGWPRGDRASSLRSFRGCDEGLFDERLERFPWHHVRTCVDADALLHHAYGCRADFCANTVSWGSDDQGPFSPGRFAAKCSAVVGPARSGPAVRGKTSGVSFHGPRTFTPIAKRA